MAAALFFGLVIAAPVRAQFDAGIPVGSKAPPMVINDLDGKPVDLGLVIGRKPVMLEFWATWCALCKALLPQLQAVKQTFGDQVELVGINVTVNDSKTRVKRYLDEHHPPFQVLFDDKGVGARAYDVPATSFIVVIDRSGKVVYTGSGAEQDLVAAVRKAVGGA
ncbi:MAG TPA: TlpA disulfide reductase family protein [Gemmatimonadales bacterium]|nr:TlpA disulfide reductase family protein [Gemmatimonadales bacterium]